MYDRDILLLDTETTGLVVRHGHEPIQIGAVRLDGRTLEERARFVSRIRPRTPEHARPASLAVHGLTLQELAGAPDAPEVMQGFTAALLTPEEQAGLAEGRAPRLYLAAHNSKFDWEFFALLVERAGLPQDALGYHMLCLWTVAVDRTAQLGLRTPTGSHSLSHLADLFGIARADRHDALEDCRVAAEVLRRLEARRVALLRELAQHVALSGAMAAPLSAEATAMLAAALQPRQLQTPQLQTQAGPSAPGIPGPATAPARRGRARH